MVKMVSLVALFILLTLVSVFVVISQTYMYHPVLKTSIGIQTIKEGVEFIMNTEEMRNEK